MAQPIYEILVNINGIQYYLETGPQQQSIAFTYQISDVKDISSRNSAQSLGVTLPYSNHNRYVFDNILDVNAQSLNFNPNLLTPVWVLVDGIEVFTGYLQVTDGELDLAQKAGSINCTLVSGNSNFWNQLGEGYLTDMDFSEYNHIYGATAIVESWTADWRNGYFYPLIDYGYGWQDINNINGSGISIYPGSITFNSVFLNQFYPATYVKTIRSALF